MHVVVLLFFLLFAQVAITAKAGSGNQHELAQIIAEMVAEDGLWFLLYINCATVLHRVEP